MRDVIFILVGYGKGFEKSTCARGFVAVLLLSRFHVVQGYQGYRSGDNIIFKIAYARNACLCYNKVQCLS